MKDNWNREINYIRISVTDRCNLRCVYCMPEEGVTCFSHSEVLSYEEIVRLARIWRKLGISRVKLTGGEPLVRKNLDTLVRALKADCGMESVTLTTNGVLLKEQIKGLVDAGLDAVNISLDTLNRKKYEKITRRDRLSDTIAGIRETLRYPGAYREDQLCPDRSECRRGGSDCRACQRAKTGGALYRDDANWARTGKKGNTRGADPGNFREGVWSTYSVQRAGSRWKWTCTLCTDRRFCRKNWVYQCHFASVLREL